MLLPSALLKSTLPVNVIYVQACVHPLCLCEAAAQPPCRRPSLISKLLPGAGTVADGAAVVL